VAKGQWRGQIVYAKSLLDGALRDKLMKLLRWRAGARTGFAEDPGSHDKYLHRHLEPELWDGLLATYADADCGKTWDALEAMCGLFRRAARPLAGRFGFVYPLEEE
jgi:aminoglycoside 6-adenylyltransferase